MRHTPARFAAAALLASCSILSLSGSASAGPRPGPAPSDVQKMFQGEAAKQVQGHVQNLHQNPRSSVDRATTPSTPDFSGSLQTRNVHEIFFFSEDFMAGREVGEPVVSAKQWIAPIQRGSTLLGTVIVWKPQGGPAEVAHFDADVERATALTHLASDEVFVQDERVGEFFALHADTIRPLNDRALAELPAAAPLAALRPVVAARIAAVNREGATMDAPVGGGAVAAVRPESRSWVTAWTAASVCLVLAGWGALALLRRSARRGGVHSPTQ